MELGTAFYEIAALLALASVGGLVGVVLRQPLVVSFIAVGILAGPGALQITRSIAYIDLLAELGVSVLLFLVGLKLDLQLVRTIGPVATATGIGQIVFTALIGFAICLALGFDAVASAYVAVALTFSSTIIIVKLLSDKREIDALHGRIALGFLIVQDLAVVVAMVVLSAVGIQAAGEGRGDLLRITVGAAGLIGAVFLFSRYAAEPMLHRLAKAPELLMTFAIGWAVLLAALGDWLGIGKELGGLLGGVSLASTSYREAISSRLSSLRDFLLLFFFVALGARLDLSALGAYLAAATVLSLFVLIGNPLIVLIIMAYMGYRRRTGFLAGLTVAQISEFSLIFMAMGVALGHVAPDTMGLVTLVGLVTIAISTYMIFYSHQLYARVEPLLAPFERPVPFREPSEGAAEHIEGHDVVLFGLGRYGRSIHERLLQYGRRVLGVDFDPELVRSWIAEGHDAIYGDATDPEFATSLPLATARWVVVAIPPRDTGLTHGDVRRALPHTLRQAGYRGKIAATSHDPADGERLRQSGVDLILNPFADAADRAVELIVGTAPDRLREPAATA